MIQSGNEKPSGVVRDGAAIFQTLAREIVKPVTEQIPSDLRDFLVYVARAIDERWSVAMSPSDDLLQNECAYGGLCEEPEATYYFRYFSGPDIVAKWDLYLTADEIMELSTGGKSSIQVWRCNDERCPNRSSVDGRDCDYCSFWVGRAFKRPEEAAEDACDTPEAWFRLFARLNPDANGRDAWQAFNQTPRLGHRVGSAPLDWWKINPGVGQRDCRETPVDP